MTGFYMGYDASKLPKCEVLAQVHLLLDKGLFSAGYTLVRLGDVSRFGNDVQTLVAKTQQLGFQIGITVKVTDKTSADCVYQQVSAVNANMVTLEGEKATLEVILPELREKSGGKKRIAVAVADTADLAWAAPLADVVELPGIPEDADYFTITRHRLDSCNEQELSIELSDANIRASYMQGNGRYQIGSLPVWFDHERNAAIFAQEAMLGCPFVIEGDIATMTDKTLALLKHSTYAKIAAQGVGRVVRYYDPWHVLMSKPIGDQGWYMIILNRCHGDGFTDILKKDIDWNGRFSVTDALTGKLLAAIVRHWEAHVETSDHPSTPCCEVYKIGKVIE